MSSLRDKLYQYEATPPASSWDKIAAALDESHLDSQFPARLHQLEADPPAAAWNRIKEALEESNADETAPVIPMRRRFVPYFRYAAAIIVIGVLGWWGAGYINDSDEGAVQLPSAAAATIDSGRVPMQETPATDLVDDQKLLAATVPATKPVRTSKNYTSKPTSAAASRTEAGESDLNFAGNTTSIADRYIMLMTPDGNFIRMSKKWSNMICCVSGEEQDADCKDQLKKWQEKLAASPHAASSGNFMDILSLVSELDNL